MIITDLESIKWWEDTQSFFALLIDSQKYFEDAPLFNIISDMQRLREELTDLEGLYDFLIIFFSTDTLGSREAGDKGSPMWKIGTTTRRFHFSDYALFDNIFGYISRREDVAKVRLVPYLERRRRLTPKYSHYSDIVFAYDEYSFGSIKL